MRVEAKVKDESGEVKEITSGETASVVSANGATQSISNAVDLLASFGDSAPLIHPAEIEYSVPGEAEMRKEQYFIKELSPSEFFKVDGKSIRRKSNGQPDFDPIYQQTHGFKHQIHACVVVNKGTDAEPRWEPLFKPDEIYREWYDKGVQHEEGLLTNARAANLIYNLLGQIWRVNPGLDPFAKEKIARKMQQENEA